MGHCQRRKANTAKHKQYGKNRRTRNKTKDLDQIVEDLPPTGEKGVIYLKSNGGSGNNIYDEYIWTGTAFEKIGTTAVDLSNYWSKTDLTAIQNGDIDSIMSGA